eukprot:GHRR01035097.1.p1 GENE.GHRR01035097.1~~GHRR01035097.1.p1  ORF type:complete len:137 (-),score=19.79 GHRR01035097.1:149-559(-)
MGLTHRYYQSWRNATLNGVSLRDSAILQLQQYAMPPTGSLKLDYVSYQVHGDCRKVLLPLWTLPLSCCNLCFGCVRVALSDNLCSGKTTTASISWLCSQHRPPECNIPKERYWRAQSTQLSTQDSARWIHLGNNWL